MHPPGAGYGRLTSVSWRKFTGVWRESSRSRVSIIPTTSASTIACAKGTRRQVRNHFEAELAFQNRLARFLENHDEPRAASVFPHERHLPAAILTFLSPGLRFFHQGQFEGNKKRVSPHLGRAPLEATDEALSRFYEALLRVVRQPAVRNGKWRLLECSPAWDGNWTWRCFIAFAWEGPSGERLLVTVNYAANRSQCFIRLPFPDLPGRRVCFKDLMSTAVYDRDGQDLSARGLYLDLPPWSHHVFSVV